MSKDISDKDVLALSNALAEGLATEADTGLALRTIQTTLGVNLINTLKTVNGGFSQLNEILDRCLLKFKDQVDALLESDTISTDDLFKMIIDIQNNQVKYLELQRKIVQSPTKIFADDLLSNDEKKLLALLKSFKTADEKKYFLKVIEDSMVKLSDNEFK